MQIYNTIPRYYTTKQRRRTVHYDTILHYNTQSYTTYDVITRRGIPLERVHTSAGSSVSNDSSAGWTAGLPGARASAMPSTVTHGAGSRGSRMAAIRSAAAKANSVNATPAPPLSDDEENEDEHEDKDDSDWEMGDGGGNDSD